jgi:IMP dehydrogenase
LPDKIADGLTFDDVLLVPKRTGVRSRKEVHTKTRLSRNKELKIPIISAPMDTVTEHAMAITMARAGGIGIIHRFMSIEQQVEEVLKVKRSESIVIEQPYSLNGNERLRDARELMAQRDVTGLLVLNDEGKLEGILTSRDILFERDPNKPVREIMTPIKDMVTAPPNTTLQDAERILHEHKVEKLPLVDREGKLCGLITSRDLLNREKYPNTSKDEKGRLMVGAAIGIKSDFMERATALQQASADVLVLDIAHAHSDVALEVIRTVKKSIPNVELIAGNVATGEGTADLIAAGADAVKVGIGSGSICITRVVTGAGVPQLTAIMECAKVADDAGIPVIGDGGIRNSGDITKAIAAGASTVMIGGLLAGTEEGPGMTVMREGRKYKLVRGMASVAASYDRLGRESNQTEIESVGGLLDYVPEGVEAFVPFKGSASELLNQLVGGLRSGLSYCGATEISQIRGKGEFIRMSAAGLKESYPHDVQVL